MAPPKLRFGWLDALILAAGLGLVGYVFYRAQFHFHYNWNWQLIPGYFVRQDAESGNWALNLLGQGFLATVRLTVWGGLLAALIGGVVGVCRVAHSLFLRLISRAYVELIRNIPPLVFIFIFYFFISGQIMLLLEVEDWVAASPETLKTLTWLLGPPELLPNFLSGLICLAMFEGAYVAEIVRAGIEAVPKGQSEAARALGMHSGQVLSEIVLPQAVEKMIPPLAGQFISLIKDSSLISLISIQELTFTGTELAVSSGRVFEVWLTVAALYFLLCFGLARLFRRLEQRLSRHRQH
jgi:polar amino acid transport system permease protein